MEHPAVLRGTEAENEARRIEMSAHQMELEGEDIISIRHMERALALRLRSGLSKNETENAAQRLVVKTNTVAVKCFKSEDYTGAIDLLDSCLKMTDPSSPVFGDVNLRMKLRGTTLNNYGCMERRRGKLDAALNYMRLSLECGGQQSPATLLNMSAIHTQQGSKHDAAGCARRAIGLLEVDGGDFPGLLAIAHHNLAMALEEIDRNECIQAYKTALGVATRELGSQSSTTKAIEKNLKRFSSTPRASGSTESKNQLSLPPIDARGATSQQTSRLNVTSRTVSVADPQAQMVRTGAPPAARPQTVDNAATGRVVQRTPIAAKVESTPIGTRKPGQQQQARQQQAPPQQPQQVWAEAHQPKPPSRTRPSTESGREVPTKAATARERPPPQQQPTERPRRGSVTRHPAPKERVAVQDPQTKPLAASATKAVLDRRGTPTEADAVPSAADRKKDRTLKSATPSEVPTATTARQPTPPAEPRTKSVTPEVATPSTSVQHSAAPPSRSLGRSDSKPHAPPTGGSTVRSRDRNAHLAGNPLPDEVQKSDDVVSFMTNRLAALLAAEEVYEEQYSAAVKIQCLFRCHMAFVKLDLRRELREQQESLQEVREKSAARTIIGFFRFLVARRRAVIEQQQKEQQIRDVWHDAAVSIQKCARRWLARQKVKRLRLYYRNYHRSLRILQCWFRQMVAKFRTRRIRTFKAAALKEKLRREEQNKAARDIQRVYAGFQAAKQTVTLKGHLRAARERDRQSNRVSAARKIQSHWRRFCAYRIFVVMKNSAASTLVKMDRVELRRHAATVIQSLARGMATRIRVAPLFVDSNAQKAARKLQKRNAAASRIQRWVRCGQSRRKRASLGEKQDYKTIASRIDYLVRFIQRAGRRFMATQEMRVLLARRNALRRISPPMSGRASSSGRTSATSVGSTAAGILPAALEHEELPKQKEEELPAAVEKAESPAREGSANRQKQEEDSIVYVQSAIRQHTAAVEVAERHAAAKAAAVSAQETAAAATVVEPSASSSPPKEAEVVAEPVPVAGEGTTPERPQTEDEAPHAESVEPAIRPDEDEPEKETTPPKPWPREPPISLQLSVEYKEKKRREELQHRIAKREAEFAASAVSRKIPAHEKADAEKRKTRAAVTIQKIARRFLTRRYFVDIQGLLGEYLADKSESEKEVLMPRPPPRQQLERVARTVTSQSEEEPFSVLTEVRSALGGAVEEESNFRAARNVQRHCRFWLSSALVSDRLTARASLVDHSARKIQAFSRIVKSQSRVKEVREVTIRSITKRVEDERAAEREQQIDESVRIIQAASASGRARIIVAALRNKQRSAAAIALQNFARLIRAKKEKQLRKSAFEAAILSMQDAENNEAAVIISAFFRFSLAKKEFSSRVAQNIAQQAAREQQERETAAAETIQGAAKIIEAKRNATARREEKQRRWNDVAEQDEFTEAAARGREEAATLIQRNVRISHAKAIAQQKRTQQRDLWEQKRAQAMEEQEE